MWWLLFQAAIEFFLKYHRDLIPEAWNPFRGRGFLLQPQWDEDGAVATLSNQSALQERRLETIHHGKWHDSGCPECDNDWGYHMHLWYICKMPTEGGNCPHFSNGHFTTQVRDGKCYYFIRECRTFVDADSMCNKNGGWLVQIRSKEENEFISSAANGDAYWIGLARKTHTGGWQWRDKSPLTWSNWDKGQPDAHSNQVPNYVFMNYWEWTGRASHCNAENAEEWLGLIILIALGILSVWTGLYFGIACCYKASVSSRPRPFPSAEQNGLHPFGLGGGSYDFGIQLCQCFEDCGTCVNGWFCMQCRAADTHDITEVGQGYWCTICGLWAIGFLGLFLDSICLGLTSGAFDAQFRNWLSGLLMAIFFCNRRQRLRMQLGAARPSDQGCMDFLVWWCCSPCTTVQEARTVDAIQGLHQECCCKLAPGIFPATQHHAKQQVGLVGGPVQLAVGQVIGQPVAADKAGVAGPPVVVVAQPVAVVAQPAQQTNANNEDNPNLEDNAKR